MTAPTFAPTDRGAQLALGLSHLPGRCPTCEFHIERQGCRCEGSEWAIFTAAIKQAAVGGVVHQNDVRPIIRGRIQPKHIGLMYRRAKASGLLVEIGHDESKDFVGKNAGRLEPRYELRSAA